MTDGNLAEYTVSELSGAVKKTLEEGFGYVRVRGELGRVSRPSSGHVYLDLKDEKAVLASVIWKGVASKLKVQPEQGLEVICTGRLTTFAGQSRYQLVIEHMEPAGVGALMALLESRKKMLAAEGLFAPERKRPLPYLPDCIGVITSPSGAVIRDILHRLNDRFPRRVLVWPVRVQGETCAEEVARAVAGFNAIRPGGDVPRPDILIVARGGGSLEDLWGFNEEIVARTVAQSDIPVISAVGHETDTTLIDYVADLRAPTPTAAAEIAVPVRSELQSQIADLGRRQNRAAARFVSVKKDRLAGLSRGLPKLEDMLAVPRQSFDFLSSRLTQGLGRQIEIQRSRFTNIEQRLSLRMVSMSMKNALSRVQDLHRRLLLRQQSGLTNRRERVLALTRELRLLSHESVLARGFALVFDPQGQAIRRVSQAPEGSRLTIQLADDQKLEADVVAAASQSVAKPSKKEKSVPVKKPAKITYEKANKPKQGDLF